MGQGDWAPGLGIDIAVILAILHEVESSLGIGSYIFLLDIANLGKHLFR